MVRTTVARQDATVAGPATRHSEPLIQIALLGEAIEHMPVGVFVFDEDGRYTAVNGHACTILGYDRDELLARRVGDLAVDPRAAFRSYLDVVEGRAEEGETQVLAADGGVVALRFRASRTRVAGMTFYVAVAWEAPAR